MSNPIKKEYDKLSLAKDIAEREKIVYQQKHHRTVVRSRKDPLQGFKQRNDVRA